VDIRAMRINACAGLLRETPGEPLQSLLSIYDSRFSGWPRVSCSHPPDAWLPEV